MNITCPVCLRHAHASEPNGYVWQHNDTAHNRCPMSGHRYPMELIRDERRAS